MVSEVVQNTIKCKKRLRFITRVNICKLSVKLNLLLKLQLKTAISPLAHSVLFILPKCKMYLKGRNSNYTLACCNYTQHTVPSA
jgi:hypothetical protein